MPARKKLLCLWGLSLLAVAGWAFPEQSLEGWAPSDGILTIEYTADDASANSVTVRFASGSIARYQWDDIGHVLDEATRRGFRIDLIRDLGAGKRLMILRGPNEKSPAAPSRFDVQRRPSTIEAAEPRP